MKNSCVEAAKWFDDKSEKCIYKCLDFEEYINNSCTVKEGHVDTRLAFDVVSSKNSYAIDQVPTFIVYDKHENKGNFYLHQTSKMDMLDNPLLRNPIEYWEQEYAMGTNNIQTPNLKIYSNSQSADNKPISIFYRGESLNAPNATRLSTTKSFKLITTQSDRGIISDFKSRTKYHSQYFEYDDSTCIKMSGCSITSISMVLSYYGIEKSPLQVYQENGHTCLANWYFRKHSNDQYDYETFSTEMGDIHKKIRESINQGRPVIAWSSQIPGLLGTHYVVIYGFDYTDNIFYVYDLSYYNYKTLPTTYDWNYLIIAYKL